MFTHVVELNDPAEFTILWNFVLEVAFYVNTMIGGEKAKSFVISITSAVNRALESFNSGAQHRRPLRVAEARQLRPERLQLVDAQGSV